MIAVCLAALAAAAPSAPAAVASSACTGKSDGLDPADCSAWQQIFDTMNGDQWNKCKDSRNDPCGCSEDSTGWNAQVSCEQNKITGIDLENMGLEDNPGMIDPAIGDLS